MQLRGGLLARGILFGMSVFLVVSAKVTVASPQTVKLTADGEKLQVQYAEMLSNLQVEIKKALPVVPEMKKAALQKARIALKTAEAEANSAQKSQEKINTARALVDHAKGKWIGGADKGIAVAETALKKATTEADREAAKKELAKWQANKKDGITALNERQTALDQALVEQASISKSIEAAQAALVRAQANELSAAESILADLQSILSSEDLDAHLIRAVVFAKATPRGLAEFAQEGKVHAALVDRLLADQTLMKQMLMAGGAKAGQYGPAIQIYTAIQLASPKAQEGVFQRLALAVSLEHAVPIKQSNAPTATDAPNMVDPVKRYLHYEKAHADGELDPAFKNFSVWEYRMVVDSDAPDSILAWGREMLRNYRPDHIDNPDYGWRYSGTVRTEVKYGSEHVKDDLPDLHNYQNIPKNGGVCGRRAFFGRFILKSFGIPTWGVTQHKHAALSHWTPKGWVINLGAGFHHSWWDRGECPRSGLDFLLETQARAQPQHYLKVLRAQWVSHALGEQEFNDRKRVEGDFWSSVAQFQARAIATMSQAVELKALGQEFAEANESEAKKTRAVKNVEVTEADKKHAVDKNGTITIPAVDHRQPIGHFTAMRSFAGGLQLHATGGYKSRYAIDAPHTGTYRLTARVATVQEGQRFFFAVNDANPAVEVAVPYTIGMWQQCMPVEVDLVKGQNVLHFAIKEGSRGVTIKEFTLSRVK